MCVKPWWVSGSTPAYWMVGGPRSASQAAGSGLGRSLVFFLVCVLIISILSAAYAQSSFQKIVFLQVDTLTLQGVTYHRPSYRNLPFRLLSGPRWKGEVFWGDGDDFPLTYAAQLGVALQEEVGGSASTGFHSLSLGPLVAHHDVEVSGAHC